MDFSKIVCYWYKMDGDCKEEDCPYAHSFDEIELCRRWREGTCPHVVECHHRHYYKEAELDTLEITLCRKWQKGECIIPSDCAFRHYYTEEDDKVEKSKRFSSTSEGPSIQFTGPINVKVTIETRELRQEQYDLDTGETRTWTETEEYEVVDLTEDTPVRVGAIDHVDLTVELEEVSIVEQERKPLADLRNRFGIISHLPVNTGTKLSKSTSNLSLNISSVRNPLRSTSTPLLSQSAKEMENFNESNMSSTFGSSLLVGPSPSPSKRHKLSSSTSDLFNESSVLSGKMDLELVRSRLLEVGTNNAVTTTPRVRRNSMRV